MAPDTSWRPEAEEKRSTTLLQSCVEFRKFFVASLAGFLELRKQILDASLADQFASGIASSLHCRPTWTFLYAVRSSSSFRIAKFSKFLLASLNSNIPSSNKRSALTSNARWVFFTFLAAGIMVWTRCSFRVTPRAVMGVCKLLTRVEISSSVLPSRLVAGYCQYKRTEEGAYTHSQPSRATRVLSSSHSATSSSTSSKSSFSSSPGRSLV